MAFSTMEEMIAAYGARRAVPGASDVELLSFMREGRPAAEKFMRGAVGTAAGAAVGTAGGLGVRALGPRRQE